MANKGTIRVGLLTVEADFAKDPATTIDLIPSGRSQRAKRFAKKKFPPRSGNHYQFVKLDAFPDERFWHIRVFPKLYRSRASGFFVLTSSETVERNLTVFRTASKWRAEFQKWRGLSTEFKAFQKVLRSSSNLKVKEGKTYAEFTGATYDEPKSQRTELAKTAILNLRGKMTMLREPFKNRTWFSFVRRLVMIDRERFVALVDAKMAEPVRKIRDQDFEGYNPAAAGNHHRNIVRAFPDTYEFRRQDMFSIKSEHEKGNLQLTLAPGKGPGGAPVLALDADIDENGRWHRHLADVFRHKFTGGTHPNDIHEFLRLYYRGLDLGYRLVPA